ncbi:hypothetical protein A7P95_06080 [Eikenella longinqua]|uniref:Uncharacterized protein n=1 Tax=Eikenella longinqua TaxID=1795827 RepID=A0A1A9RX91_9NEIS|nr:hypothetical protein A7P95_06080 [Eikenella longinqua]
MGKGRRAWAKLVLLVFAALGFGFGCAEVEVLASQKFALLILTSLKLTLSGSLMAGMVEGAS